MASTATTADEEDLKEATEPDYYAILGVSRTAGQRAISRAYRKLQKQHKANNPQSQAYYDAIERAYEVLNHPTLRQKYDRFGQHYSSSGASTHRQTRVSRDFYKLLKVPRDASDREIKASYRKLVKQYHPDAAHNNDDDTTEQFQDINRAYEVLSHPSLKPKYDAYGEYGLPTLDEFVKSYGEEEGQRSSNKQADDFVDEMFRDGFGTIPTPDSDGYYDTSASDDASQKEQEQQQQHQDTDTTHRSPTQKTTSVFGARKRKPGRSGRVGIGVGIESPRAPPTRRRRSTLSHRDAFILDKNLFTRVGSVAKKVKHTESIRPPDAARGASVPSSKEGSKRENHDNNELTSTVAETQETAPIRSDPTSMPDLMSNPRDPVSNLSEPEEGSSPSPTTTRDTASTASSGTIGSLDKRRDHDCDLLSLTNAVQLEDCRPEEEEEEDAGGLDFSSALIGSLSPEDHLVLPQEALADLPKGNDETTLDVPSQNFAVVVPEKQHHDESLKNKVESYGPLPNHPKFGSVPKHSPTQSYLDMLSGSIAAIPKDDQDDNNKDDEAESAAPVVNRISLVLHSVSGAAQHNEDDEDAEDDLIGSFFPQQDPNMLGKSSSPESLVVTAAAVAAENEESDNHAGSLRSRDATLEERQRCSRRWFL